MPEERPVLKNAKQDLHLVRISTSINALLRCDMQFQLELHADDER
jgi:hypothetical protein